MANIAQTTYVKDLKAEDTLVSSVIFDNIDLNNYTSFEVYPHNVDISVGTIDADTGLQYKTKILANMYLAIKFYTYESALSDVDIRVDVDDGLDQPIAIKDLNEYASSNPSALTSDDDPYAIDFTPYTNYCHFVFVYKYKNSGKHIVKVYGHDFFMMRCGGSRTRIQINEQTPSSNITVNTEPIISRIFERDLKVAPNLVNASSICNGSKCIQRVYIPYEYSLNNITNIANMFKNCSNLLCASCSDGVITKKLQAFSGLFLGCSNLSGDISSVYNIFANGSEDGNYESAFYGTKLSCSDYEKLANIFWNNSIANVNSTSAAFTGCTNLDLTKIPVEWGGLADISMSYKDKSIKENIKQNDLIDVCLRYCLGDGNLIQTSTNGYEFTPVSDITSNVLDYKNDINLIEIRKLGSSITTINQQGFANCYNLKIFNADGAQISSIPYAAFRSSNKLIEIKNLENVKTIDGNAFNDCSSLIMINDNNSFPEVTAFNGNSKSYAAFFNCQLLRSISFPKMTIDGLLSNATISNDCKFFNRSSFKRINLPSITSADYDENNFNWVTYIPSGCSVILSNDVTIIKT